MTQRTFVGVDISYNSLSKGHAFKRREGLSNTYGRLLLDLRRLLFRIGGDRLTWLDYFIEGKRWVMGKSGSGSSTSIAIRTN